MSGLFFVVWKSATGKGLEELRAACGKLPERFENCAKNALVFFEKVGYT